MSSPVCGLPLCSGRSGLVSVEAGLRRLGTAGNGGASWRRWLASVEANLRGDGEENGDCRVFTSWRLVQENGLLGLEMAMSKREWRWGREWSCGRGKVRGGDGMAERFFFKGKGGRRRLLCICVGSLVCFAKAKTGGKWRLVCRSA